MFGDPEKMKEDMEEIEKCKTMDDARSIARRYLNDNNNIVAMMHLLHKKYETFMAEAFTKASSDAIKDMEKKLAEIKRFIPKEG